MPDRLAFHPDLIEASLESRVLPAGTLPIMPFLLNGSSFGLFFNVWGFSNSSSGSSSSSGSASGVAPSFTSIWSSGGNPQSGSATTTSVANGSVLSGVAAIGTAGLGARLSVGIQVGSGANRAGGGSVGYGSSFASGYSFGLNAINGYGSATNPLGATLPLGATGIAMSASQGNARNSAPGQSMDSDRLRATLTPPPDQNAQPFNPAAGAPTLYPGNGAASPGGQTAAPVPEPILRPGSELYPR